MPISTKAGDITSICIVQISGAKNKNSRKITTAKTAVNPVRPPCAIPTPDSTTTVDGLELIIT